jgi:hypothetical protein
MGAPKPLAPEDFNMGRRDNDSDEPVELEDVTCILETDKAIQCESDDFETMWFPKSQICDESEVQKDGDTGTLVIKAWLARDRGLST